MHEIRPAVSVFARAQIGHAEVGGGGLEQIRAGGLFVFALFVLLIRRQKRRERVRLRDHIADIQLHRLTAFAFFTV